MLLWCRSPFIVFAAALWLSTCSGSSTQVKDDGPATDETGQDTAAPPLDILEGDRPAETSVDTAGTETVETGEPDLPGDEPDAPPAIPCPIFGSGVLTGQLESDLLLEASGLVASRQNPGVLWSHNDSGGEPRVFAFDISGKHLGIYDLPGAEAYDWEDMAADDTHLYLADIGDNFKGRSSITVYRAVEPDVSTDQSPTKKDLTGVTAFDLVYPDQAHDAEALLVDPANGDIYIVTKDFDGGSLVYRAPAPQDESVATVMELVAELTLALPDMPGLFLTATGGDVSPDGSAILITAYSGAFWWPRAKSAPFWEAFSGDPCPAPIVPLAMMEAIGFDTETDGYYTIPEGTHAPIHHYSYGD